MALTGCVDSRAADGVAATMLEIGGLVRQPLELSLAVGGPGYAPGSAVLFGKAS